MAALRLTENQICNVMFLAQAKILVVLFTICFITAYIYEHPKAVKIEGTTYKHLGKLRNFFIGKEQFMNSDKSAVIKSIVLAKSRKHKDVIDITWSFNDPKKASQIYNDIKDKIDINISMQRGGKGQRLNIWHKKHTVHFSTAINGEEEKFDGIKLIRDELINDQDKEKVESVIAIMDHFVYKMPYNSGLYTFIEMLGFNSSIFYFVLMFVFMMLPAMLGSMFITNANSFFFYVVSVLFGLSFVGIFFNFIFVPIVLIASNIALRRFYKYRLQRSPSMKLYRQIGIVSLIINCLLVNGTALGIFISLISHK